MNVPIDERLGPHHFANLRAVAEGVSVVESARDYLFIGSQSAPPMQSQSEW